MTQNYSFDAGITLAQIPAVDAAMMARIQQNALAAFATTPLGHPSTPSTPSAQSSFILPSNPSNTQMNSSFNSTMPAPPSGSIIPAPAPKKDDTTTQGRVKRISKGKGSRKRAADDTVADNKDSKVYDEVRCQLLQDHRRFQNETLTNALTLCDLMTAPSGRWEVLIDTRCVLGDEILKEKISAEFSREHFYQVWHWLRKVVDSSNPRDNTLQAY
ncbi:hypothetical protein F4804DRAFT_325752 [Jackrogersella minutella]|nr:hypothetical protein F4804DRAFT_325752 [Jackrogersella minutella]